MVKRINIYAKETLRTLKRADRRLTTRQVAEKSGMKWETAKKYLGRLNNRGLIHTQKAGNRRFWSTRKSDLK